MYSFRYIKKLYGLLGAVLIITSFSSCGILSSFQKVPEVAEIDGQKWILAYENGYLYPNDMTDTGTSIGSNGIYKFYEIKGETFDIALCYSNNLPNIYFKAEDIDEARTYYDSPENYTYYCVTGNIYGKEEHSVYELTDLNIDKFEEICEFANENSYNPTNGIDDRDGTRAVPFDPESDFTDNEVVFYKESKDGFLTTSTGSQFIMLDNKLVLLYYYYLDGYSDDPDPRMYVVDVPDELGDYFVDIVNNLE